MNRKLAYSVVGAGALLLLGTVSNAQAFELLGRMFNGYGAASYGSYDVGCGVEPGCGVEAGCGMAADCGCEPTCAPACRPRHRLFGCFKRRCRKASCCAPATCAPACEPACEPVCEPCCKPKRGCCGWLKGLFRHHRRGGCCAPAPSCGCEAPAGCGCGI